MKYVSIDCETTGLKPDSNQLLEIGMVIEDTEDKIDIAGLPHRRILLPSAEYQINTYCMNMHRELFAELDLVDRKRLEVERYYRHSPKTYFAMPDAIEGLMTVWLNKHLGERKYVVAGKNFYGFDNNFLKPHLSHIKFHHRSLDPVTLYMKTTDEIPPDLSLCCERAGIKLEAHHTAVGDAKTVIRLLRKAYAI